MNLPKPFLGRLILEAMEDDVEGYMKEKAGISRDSMIALPDEYKEKNKVPLNRGKVIAMAPDSFNEERFQARYGKDARQDIQVGDIVWFIPNQTFPLDIARKYHVIADDHIIVFEKGE